MDFLRRALPGNVGRYAERYLQGVRFPIRKQELVAQLERNGVPSPILSQLRKRLPEREYGVRRTSPPPCGPVGADRGR